MAGTMAKLLNLPIAPTAADASTPKVLTSDVMNRNDKFVITFCTLVGMPTRSSILRRLP